MSYTSDQLQLTFQNLDDNPDTWGDVLNDSALELFEDAIAGMSDVVLSDANDKVLDTTIGGDAATHYRKMIIDISGSPGGDTNIIVPARTGIYLAYDGSGGGDTLTLKTPSGSGVELVATVAIWCYCDGTDVLSAEVKNAATATLATTATNATQLGGVDAADYAQKGVQNQYTAGQSTERVTLTDAGNIITPTLADSNTFYVKWSDNYTLAAPTGGSNGATFSLVAEQDTAGSPPFTITFAINTFIFPGATVPALSTASGAIDYLAFEFVDDITGGGRWMVTVLKGFGG